MQSINSVLVKSYLGLKRFLRFGKPIDLAEQRARLESMTGVIRQAENVQIKPFMIENLAAEWIIPETDNPEICILYTHGGAYCAGSLNTHRAYLSHLAAAGKFKILNIDYRLAPEHPYPAALEDAVSAYEYLTNENANCMIFLAGDSAGGGLALALTLKLRDQDSTLPSGLILFAPWVDLVCDNETYQSVGRKDIMLDQRRLKKNARMYAGEADIKLPYISPVYADLSDLPPVFINVGTHDSLLGEAQQLAARIESAGTRVRLKIWPGMMHGWENLVNLLPEAREALSDTIEFIRLESE